MLALSVLGPAFKNGRTENCQKGNRTLIRVKTDFDCSLLLAPKPLPASLNRSVWHYKPARKVCKNEVSIYRFSTSAL